MEKALCIYVFLLVCYVWTPVTDAQLDTSGGVGILTTQDVARTEGTVIMSRVGCFERLVCIGNGMNGTSVRWRLFGGPRGELALGTNRMINTTSYINGDGSFSFRSELIFNPVLRIDFASFTCTIGVVAAVDLRVAPDLGAVTISSSVSDLSNTTIGSDIFIVCSVDTCITDVTLTLMTRRTEIDSIVLPNSNINSTADIQFNFIVGGVLMGEYSCRIMGSYMGTSFDVSDALNITGTPQPAPTPITMKPSRDAGSNLHATITTVLFLVVFLAALLS